jgi:hypothetical protein
MKKSRKPLSRAGRVDRYLYENSYFYKWGKLLLKNRVGRFMVMTILLAVLIYFGLRVYKQHQIKSFLVEWQHFQNTQQYGEFMGALDMSKRNPYKSTFPDWEGQFFHSEVKLLLRDISVRKVESGLYRASAHIIFQVNNRIENQFDGFIFVKKNKDFKIIRVEI